MAVEDVLLKAEEMATMDMRLHMYQCRPGSVILSAWETTHQNKDATVVHVVTHIFRVKSLMISSVNRINPVRIEIDQDANHSIVFVCFATFSKTNIAPPMNINTAADARTLVLAM